MPNNSVFDIRCLESSKPWLLFGARLIWFNRPPPDNDRLIAFYTFAMVTWCRPFLDDLYHFFQWISTCPLDPQNQRSPARVDHVRPDRIPVLFEFSSRPVSCLLRRYCTSQMTPVQLFEPTLLILETPVRPVLGLALIKVMKVSSRHHALHSNFGESMDLFEEKALGNEVLIAVITSISSPSHDRFSLSDQASGFTKDAHVFSYQCLSIYIQGHPSFAARRI